MDTIAWFGPYGAPVYSQQDIERLREQYRVRQVLLRDINGNDKALCILAIHQTPDGVVVVCQ